MATAYVVTRRPVVPSRTCLASCRGAHRAFNLDLGDRATATFAEAIEIATSRAGKHGRQTVRRHVGPVFRRGVWFVQSEGVVLDLNGEQR